MTIGDDEVSQAVQADAPTQRTQVRRAAMASAIGTTIEWYDFFLYNTAAALVFPHFFFPESSSYAGAMQSFATYFVGFAARPIGAAIFGHWGDRIGRKTTLIITLLVMGLASAVIGIMPGTATIGVAAPIILVLLRVLQGIAVGGEWSGSVLMSGEWARPAWTCVPSQRVGSTVTSRRGCRPGTMLRAGSSPPRRAASSAGCVAASRPHAWSRSQDGSSPRTCSLYWSNWMPTEWPTELSAGGRGHRYRCR